MVSWPTVCVMLPIESVFFFFFSCPKYLMLRAQAFNAKPSHRPSQLFAPVTIHFAPPLLAVLNIPAACP